MFVPELVLIATEIGNITSKAVLSGGFSEEGGGIGLQEVLAKAVFILAFGYIGIKLLTGEYTNREN